MLGQKKERGEGEGRKKIFSLPALLPRSILLTRPIFSILFEFQHGTFATKTFARPKKTPALQANDKLMAKQSNLYDIKILPVKALQLEPLPPPVSDRDQFLGLTVNDFPLFLTSCKRPLDAFSDLYVRCVHYAT